MIDSPLPTKPRLRGVWHQWACIVSVPLGLALVFAASSTRDRLALGVYALSLVALFGVSATYHRVNWRSLNARRWMRRLDHSMIFMLIAGTYTPFAVISMHGTLSLVILVGVWALALIGAFFNLVWINAPKWLVTAIYLALGWAAAATLPQLLEAIGVGGMTLLVVSGVFYTGGAVIYAIKRPNPMPTVFGYHELFHVLVVAAAALQYAVIAFWVVPSAGVRALVSELRAAVQPSGSAPRPAPRGGAAPQRGHGIHGLRCCWSADLSRSARSGRSGATWVWRSSSHHAMRSWWSSGSCIGGAPSAAVIGPRAASLSARRRSASVSQMPSMCELV